MKRKVATQIVMIAVPAIVVQLTAPAVTVVAMMNLQKAAVTLVAALLIQMVTLRGARKIKQNQVAQLTGTVSRTLEGETEKNLDCLNHQIGEMIQMIDQGEIGGLVDQLPLRVMKLIQITVLREIGELETVDLLPLQVMKVIQITVLGEIRKLETIDPLFHQMKGMTKMTAPAEEEEERNLVHLPLQIVTVLGKIMTGLGEAKEKNADEVSHQIIVVPGEESEKKVDQLPHRTDEKMMTSELRPAQHLDTVVQDGMRNLMEEG